MKRRAALFLLALAFGWAGAITMTDISGINTVTGSSGTITFVSLAKFGTVIRAITAVTAPTSEVTVVAIDTTFNEVTGALTGSAVKSKLVDYMTTPLGGFQASATQSWMCDSVHITYYNSSANTAVGPLNIDAASLTTISACTYDPVNSRAVFIGKTGTDMRICTIPLSAMPTSGSAMAFDATRCSKSFTYTLSSAITASVSSDGKYLLVDKSVFDINCATPTSSTPCPITSGDSTKLAMAAAPPNNPMLAPALISQLSSSKLVFLDHLVTGTLTRDAAIYEEKMTVSCGAVDVIPRMVYYHDGSNMIARAPLDSFYLGSRELHTITSASVSDAKASLLATKSGFLIVASATNAGVMSLRVVRLADCNSATVAAACVVDQDYCSWNVFANKCIYRANEYDTNGACVGANDGNCVNYDPYLTSVTPSTGSISGGTRISIAIPFTLWNYSLKCSLSGLKTTATYDKVNKIVSCATPKQASTPTPSAVTVKVLFNNNDVAPNSKVTFTYYDCAQYTTCGQCAGASATSECVWCPLSRKCISSVADTCQYNDASFGSPLKCPSFLSVTPSSGPMGRSINVTASVANLISGAQYSCKFGTLAEQPGVVNVATESVICPTPAYTSSLPVETLPLALYYTFNGKPSAPFVDPDALKPTMPFQFYSCQKHTTCGDCTASAGCNWCIDGATKNFTCFSAGSGACSGTAFVKGSCPALVKFTPSSIDLEAGTPGASLPVAVQVNTLVSGLTYTCSSGNATVELATNTVTCSVTPPSGAGIVPIVISVTDSSNKPRVYVDAGNFWFFNCSTTSSGCDACTKHTSGLCGWCMVNKQGSCTSAAKCQGAGLWANPTCPKITSIKPSYYNVEGTNVVVNGGPFPLAGSSRSFQCLLKDTAGTTVATATPTAISGSSINCSFPALTAAASQSQNVTTPASVVVEETASVDSTFADTASFKQPTLIVDCSQQLASLTCGECITVRSNLCVWSRTDGFCTTEDRAGNAVAHGNTNGCPSLLLIDPSSGSTKGGYKVTIIGSSFINDTAVTLKLTGADATTVLTAPTVFANSTTLTAVMPKSSVSGRLSVALTIRGRNFAVNNLLRFEYTKPFNYAILAIPIVGGALLLAAAAIIIAFVVARKRSGLSDFKFDNKEPDYNKLLFPGTMAAVGAVACRADDPRWASFREAIEVPAVASAVCAATQQTEADKVAKALVCVHAADSKAVPLLSNFIVDEINRTEDPNQLFRGNSFASKMFRDYSKLVGLQFLWLRLGRIIAEMAHIAGVLDKRSDGEGAAKDVELEKAALSSNVSIMMNEAELDPNKMTSGADEESQSYVLAQRARTVMLLITKDVHTMPSTLRWIVHVIRDSVSKKFSASVHNAIGGVLVLRFINPAITCPHLYGLLRMPPNERLQRQLVLLSKVLQNAANGSLFGKKEEFMMRMNDFLARNMIVMQDWMDEVANVGAEANNESAMSIPDDVIEWSLSYVRKHVEENHDKVIQALQRSGAGRDVIEKLEAALRQTSS